MILTLDLTGLQIWQLILAQVPVSLLAITGGYLFLLRRIPSGGDEKPVESATGKSFLSLAAPIATVIATYAAILIAFPAVKDISRYIPIMVGLFLSLIVLQIQRKAHWSSWKAVLLSRRTLYMTVLVAVIRIYGAMIEAPLPDGMLLVEQMRGELAVIGVPESLFILLIPLISGVAVGINVGMVGASFPVVLAYAAGFMGQMLSPVHVCLVVTNQYFKTSLLSSLSGLLLPVAVVLAGTYCFTLLLRLLLAG